jgi:two-component system, chemotaxis family, protein-glutamate methylesterase/glutaminase
VIGRHLDDLRRAAPRLVAIGASAGALEALLALVPPLPRTFPVPVVVAVHVPPDRDSGLPMVIARQSAVAIVEAEDKMPLLPGHVYFAPPDYHLLVERHGALALSTDALVQYSRPSIDVLFESVAAAMGARSVGILLSGANADGAAGLAAIGAAGGLTWVQSPASARISTMPEAALATGDHQTLDPATMGTLLAAWAGLALAGGTEKP